MTAALRFRQAQPADAQAIVALVESAYRGEQSQQGWTTEADLLDGQRTDLAEVTALIAQNQSQILLAESRDQRAGNHESRDQRAGNHESRDQRAGNCESKTEQQTQVFACAHLSLHPDGCHFGMYAVRPDLQNQGVGKLLLAEGERRAVSEFGARHMVMWVIWTRQSLIEYYQRRGYQISPDREAFPYGDARFGLPKRSDLYFIVMRKPLP